jgi:medium-chain acyl-CoA ligase, mitochondrial
LYALTLSPFVPTVFVDLISKQREMNVNLPNINIANTAGAICTPNLVKDIQKHLNVKKVRSIYGLTETTAAVFQSLPDDGNETLQNSVGFQSDHTEVKIIDKNGDVVPLGQAGELCVRGYMTLMDYFDDVVKTNEVLSADGWFKTGDQFVLHENGYANIVGRLKEMIIRGGENLYPREIEDFLNTHPNIEETHVVGESKFECLSLINSAAKPKSNA